MGDREHLPDCSGEARPIVVDADGHRLLQFDGVTIQSQMALDDPGALALDYTRLMMAFLLFHPAPKHIAMIGLGGGSLVKYCLDTLPDTVITVVEINPAVIALRDAFHIPPDGPRLQVLCRDGTDYVRDPGESPDVLMVDGFDVTGLPPQLCTVSFYDHCHAMLAEGGMMVANLWAGDRRYGLYASRIRDCFADRMVVVRAEEDSNRIVFAGKDECFPPGRALLHERARALAATHALGLVEVAKRIEQRLDHHRRFRDDPWLPER